jgi:hypothetical protein
MMDRLSFIVRIVNTRSLVMMMMMMMMMCLFKPQMFNSDNHSEKIYASMHLGF